MVISLAIIMHAIVGNIHVFPAKMPAGIGTVPMRIKIVATMSLSATGSRNAPNGVEQFQARARYPSKKSVIEAPTKHQKHQVQWDPNQKATRAGMATTRSNVRMVGMVNIVVVEDSPASWSPTDDNAHVIVAVLFL